jgi:hypothetical protein
MKTNASLIIKNSGLIFGKRADEEEEDGDDFGC